MAGFLDSKERIVDMVLTGAGKRLLAQGDLRFVYWVPFDDEVDYDPFVAESGSLAADVLAQKKSSLTEEPLVREACSGYRIHDTSVLDRTNLNRPMMTIPPGRSIVPSMAVLGDSSGSIDVQSDQTMSPTGLVERSGSSEVAVQLGYGPGDYDTGVSLEGFLITVYRSGSDGLVEVLSNRDSSGAVTYLNDLVLETS